MAGGICGGEIEAITCVSVSWFVLPVYFIARVVHEPTAISGRRTPEVCG
jgi:hypothetical protein